MYTIVISDGYLAPIFSMLSEIHNANFIGFWMKEFIRLGGTIPNEFTVDMSLALLNAAATAFTAHMNLKSYINELFNLNFGKTSLKSECFIRIDIAHLIKAVASCKHFANKRPKVRETYLRCIGLLIKETDIEEARKIIHSVLIMAYSVTEGMRQKYNLFLYVLDNIFASFIIT